MRVIVNRTPVVRLETTGTRLQIVVTTDGEAAYDAPVIQPKLQRLVRTLHPLLSAVVPVLAAEGSPEPSFEDVCTYLEVGGDLTTRDRLLSPTPNFESYLALLHEHAELRVVRPFLDSPAPAKKGLFRPSGRAFTQRSSHPWSERMADRAWVAEGPRGDPRARSLEAEAVRALARIFLGEDVDVAALLWSVEAATQASGGDLTANNRAAFNDLLRAERARDVQRPDASRLEAAKLARDRVHCLTVAAVLRMGSVERLAYALWEARQRPLWEHQRDWRAAEDAWIAACASE
ncbi:hypothetical protein WME88_21290 [Sorangium sp. So ce216]